MTLPGSLKQRLSQSNHEKGIWKSIWQSVCRRIVPEGGYHCEKRQCSLAAKESHGTTCILIAVDDVDEHPERKEND